MITYDWPLLIISALSSAAITLATIVYLVDLTIYIRICGLSSV